MNGDGAVITFGGDEYSVDSTKLSAAMESFVAHLGTIAGNGHKVVVGGTEYSIDSTKLTDAISEIEAVLAGTDEERLEGDGAEFYTMAPTALSFRSTAPLNELQEIQINGVTVDPSNYTLEEGSTIVTFPIEYLKTLNVGNYEVAVASDSKSVKGNFTVAAPELNEYGFYYNQPYIGYVQGYGNVALFYREGGVLDFIIVDGGYVETATYTVSGNAITNNVSLGAIPTTISNGDEIQCAALGATFKLGDTSIAADVDYMYVYKEDLGGYEVTAIDKTKAEYSAIKTGINGYQTVALNYLAFRNNKNLVVAPTIPDSVTRIENEQFSGCSNMTSITLPANLTHIGDDAFYSCHKLKSINIPESVEYIGSRVFDHCSELISVNIPSCTTSIGQRLFGSCSALTDITVSSGNPLYCGVGNCLIQTASKELIAGCKASVIPNDGSVEIIAPYAFNGIRGIESIFIPDGVTTIYYESFIGCTDVTSISIPASLTDVHKRSFDGTNLTNIVFRGTKQQYYKIKTKLKESIEVNDASGRIIEVVCSDGTETINIE